MESDDIGFSLHQLPLVLESDEEVGGDIVENQLALNARMNKIIDIQKLDEDYAYRHHQEGMTYAPESLTPHAVISRELGSALEMVGAASVFSRKGLKVLVRHIKMKVDMPLNFKFYSQRVAKKIALMCGPKYIVVEDYMDRFECAYFRVKHIGRSS